MRSELTSGWDKAVGTVYFAHSVTSRLGLTLEELGFQMKERRLLGLRTREGTLVFPTYQFQEDEIGRWEIVPGLEAVLSQFGKEAIDDGWTLAGWLNHPWPQLGGQSVIDRLKAGDSESTEKLVSSTAHIWEYH